MPKRRECFDELTRRYFTSKWPCPANMSPNRIFILLVKLGFWKTVEKHSRREYLDTRQNVMQVYTKSFFSAQILFNSFLFNSLLMCFGSKVARSRAHFSIRFPFYSFYHRYLYNSSHHSSRTFIFILHSNMYTCFAFFCRSLSRSRYSKKTTSKALVETQTQELC